MIILGLDPGSITSGFGVVKLINNKIEYIDSGIIKFKKPIDFFEKIQLIYKSFCKISTTYNPNEIALESLIYVKNVSALAKLSQARGAMISSFSQNPKIRFFEYSPNLIKSAVAGHGHADKESIRKMVILTLGVNIEFKSHDESDALAIAICHAINRKNKIHESEANSLTKDLKRHGNKNIWR